MGDPPAPLPRGPVRRIVYLGTPAEAVPPLRALHHAGVEIALVVTNPDRRRGRGGRELPSPVKAAATELGLAVSHSVDDVVAAGAQLGVVVAFGRIIRPPVLARVPMVNLHFSLLPRWRGAAPVERAVLAGDTTTGVVLMTVEEGLDTGAVHARVELDIGPDESASELRARLVAAGTSMLVDSVRDGLPPGRPQIGDPVYAAKIGRDDLRIDWSAPAEVVHRQVRVGGAWTTWRGDELKVWRTSLEPTGAGISHPTGSGDVELLEVQPAARRRMPARDWANGTGWAPTDRLGG